jgi:hypothetical protein
MFLKINESERKVKAMGFLIGLMIGAAFGCFIAAIIFTGSDDEV